MYTGTLQLGLFQGGWSVRAGILTNPWTLEMVRQGMHNIRDTLPVLLLEGQAAGVLK